MLEEGPSPYVSAGSALVHALTEGMAQGRERVEAAARPSTVTGGGWEMDPHLHDYNLDHFGVGTIDSPEWKIADREASYLVRAVAARVALWGSHGYEEVCAHTSHDADGNPLSGAHSYVMRFEQPPPVEAFWSVTMYDAPDHHPVANPAVSTRSGTAPRAGAWGRRVADGPHQQGDAHGPCRSCELAARARRGVPARAQVLHAGARDHRRQL